MSNGRNGSFFSAARWRRKSSNIVFQQLEWILAVDVRTPSRSNSTASNRSGVMGLCERLMVAPWLLGYEFLPLLHVVALGRGASGASRRGAVPRRPAPARDLRHVVAVLPNVVLVLDQLLLDRLIEIGGAGPSCGSWSITASTRWKRSMSLSTTMSKRVVVVPSSL